MAVPPGVRPTEARVREALFSIWRARLPGASFLDLFAGSGVVGFEALSRGARMVVAVEASWYAVRAARANAGSLIEGSWEIHLGELPRALERLSGARFDLVFADPPYDFEAYPEVITAVATVLGSQGVLAVEHSARVVPPACAGGLDLDDARVYGETALGLYERRREADSAL